MLLKRELAENTSVKLFKDQDSFFQKNKVLNKQSFIREAVDEKISRTKGLKTEMFSKSLHISDPYEREEMMQSEIEEELGMGGPE